MKIKKVILIGYERFVLTNTRRFEYTPGATDQVILGTNGSGKSSLLDVIGNLICHGNDFPKGGGGYMEIQLEHRNNEYKLVGEYPNKAGKHSFFMNGVDLNDGNTQATQRELIKEHFGLTPSVSGVLTGRTKFTSLGASERREWLMWLSKVDFDFVNKMYAHFKENTRDIKGYMSQLSDRIADSANDINSLGVDIEENERTVERLRAELTPLLRAAGTNADQKILKRQLFEIATSMKVSTDMILRKGSNMETDVQGATVGEMREHLSALAQSLAAINANIATHHEQMEYFSKLAHDLGLSTSDSESDNDLSEESLKTRIEKLKAESLELTSLVVRFPQEQDNADSKLQSALGIRSNLADVCGRLQPNDDGQYTRSGKQEKTDRLTLLRGDTLTLQNRIAQLNHIIEHAKHTPAVDCPECSANFKPGIKPETVARDTKEREERAAQLEGILAETKVVEAWLEDYRVYAATLSEFKAIINGAPNLTGFWNKVLSDEMQFKGPRRIPQMLETFIEEMKTFRQVNLNASAIEILNIRLEAVRKAGGGEHILKRMHDMEVELIDLETSYRGLDGRVKKQRQAIECFDLLNELGTKLKEDTEAYQETLGKLLTAMFDEQVETIINHHHQQIGVLADRVSRYATTCAIYEGMIADREKAQENFEVNQIITKALSPTEGIIAEAIRRFISFFTGMLNEHINQVWTYPMRIMAVVEGTSLNCKFPIEVQTTGGRVDDVSLGSDGQLEIVNFAFRLVMMSVLELEDFPLIIDEFGKTFDPEHRERLITYIKSLMDDQQYSQMFMVSHYSAIYGPFSQAEFVVMDDRNITVPEIYNTAVIME